jgi:hypothetical protein
MYHASTVYHARTLYDPPTWLPAPIRAYLIKMFLIFASKVVPRTVTKPFVGELYNLPDGPLTIILEILMVISAPTLLTVAAHLGTRIRVLCRNSITLKLEPGWRDGHTIQDYMAKITQTHMAGVAQFRWVKSLTLLSGDLQQIVDQGGTLANLKTLSVSCLDLETLVQESSPQLEDLAVTNFWASTNINTSCLVQPLKSGCWLSLKTLNLYGCHLDPKIFTEAISSGNTPRLASLDVSYSAGFTDTCLIAVAGVCPLLKTLNVCTCGELTHVSYVSLAAGCPLLEDLNVSDTRIVDASIRAISEGCYRNLTTLRMAHTHITDAAITNLSKTCRTLKRLNVNACRLLTDRAFLALAAGGCPDLEVLLVRGCEKITDAAVTAFAVGGGCPRLNRISAMYCFKLTGLSVKAHAGNPNIIIEIGCSCFSVGGVMGLAAYDS